MRRFRMIGRADGGVELWLGGDSLIFTAEEWQRAWVCFPKVETIEQKDKPRPCLYFAIAGLIMGALAHAYFAKP